jgi:hypothetical protein
MSESGLQIIDRNVELTNEWLNEIARSTGGSKQQAYHVLRTGLHVLRDRLTVDEGAHLAADPGDPRVGVLDQQLGALPLLGQSPLALHLLPALERAFPRAPVRLELAGRAAGGQAQEGQQQNETTHGNGGLEC